MTGLPGLVKIRSAASGLSSALRRFWPPLRRILAFSPADKLIAPARNLSVSIEQGSITVAYGSGFL